MADNERPKSPINGQPMPEGHAPFKAGEEARENGRKGGIKSGEVRRARRTLREELQDLLAEDITDKNGRRMQTQKAISASMIKQALTGSTKAFELIRDTIGEKPIDKVMVAEVDQKTIDEVERLIFDDTEPEAESQHPESAAPEETGGDNANETTGRQIP